MSRTGFIDEISPVVVDGHAHPWLTPGLSPVPSLEASWQGMLSALGEQQDASLEDVRIRLGLTRIIVDPGWPDDPSRTGWAHLGGLGHVNRLARLELVWNEALAAASDVSQLAQHIDRVMTQVRDTTAGFCGWKSIIGYGTGLDIRAPADAALRSAFDAYRTRPQDGLPKPLTDAAFLASAEWAARNATAIQLHTGLGAPLAPAHQLDPSLLVRALMEPGLADLDLVVLHAGWPHIENAGWLGGEFSRVRVDTSLIGLKYPDQLTDALRRLYRIMPAERITYGSDGHSDPRLHLICLHRARRAMEQLASEWRSAGMSESVAAQRIESYFSTATLDAHGLAQQKR